MRIGIDAYRLGLGNKTGIGMYLERLLPQLEALDKKNDYVLYTPRAFSLPFENKRWHVRLVSGPGAGINILWLLGIARAIIEKDKIDIFIGTQNLFPLFLPRGIKRILIIYDLASFIFPQTYASWLHHKVFKFLSLWSIPKADAIIAISNATAEDIKKYFPRIDKNCIHAIYPGGSSDNFIPLDKAGAGEYIAGKFSCGRKYLLTVVSMEWRKNIHGLLEGFYLSKIKFNIPHKLVIIVGSKRAPVREIAKVEKKYRMKEEVLFLDYVSDKDLLYFYNAADVFVFLSYYEGFGLPPLEAMACGTPVVASDIPVLRETLGDAALFADPADARDIARKIYHISEDAALRDALILKGFQRRGKFSWHDSAEAILKIINSYYR